APLGLAPRGPGGSLGALRLDVLPPLDQVGGRTGGHAAGQGGFCWLRGRSPRGIYRQSFIPVKSRRKEASMRTSLLVKSVAGLIMAGGVWPLAYPSCATPTPVGHQLDSYFVCPDSGHVTAYAYAQSNPALINSDSMDILCEGPDNGLCSGTAMGVPGDG